MFHDYHANARLLLRDTLLDAACEQVRGRRWEEVALGEVAQRAGIGRTRLYSEFGNREGFTRALAWRETERLLEVISSSLLQSPDRPEVACETAVKSYLSALNKSPLLAELLRVETSELAHIAQPGLAECPGRLASMIQSAWPALNPADTALLAQALTRLAVTFARTPASSPQASARSLGEIFGAFVNHKLAGPPAQ